MKVLVEAEVLAVGISDLCEYFDVLPVRICNFETAAQAISSLKYKNYDAVISRWSLADMPHGRFLRGVKLIRPGLLTAAIINDADFDEEIAARACGVNAVLTDKANEYVFSETIANLLKVGRLIKHPV